MTGLRDDSADGDDEEERKGPQVARKVVFRPSYENNNKNNFSLFSFTSLLGLASMHKPAGNKHQKRRHGFRQGKKWL